MLKNVYDKLFISNPFREKTKQKYEIFFIRKKILLHKCSLQKGNTISGLNDLKRDAKGIYFPHRQPTTIITDVGSLCRVLRVLPFRDIVLE